MVTIGQLAPGMEADFVQHAGEKEDARRFNVVAAWGLNFHVVYR
jgi:hypothetical protein